MFEGQRGQVLREGAARYGCPILGGGDGRGQLSVGKTEPADAQPSESEGLADVAENHRRAVGKAA